MINFPSSKRKLTTRKIATLAILCAMGLIMFMIESLFPPLFVPGAKMGLSNIVSLLTLVLYGPWEALLVVVVRTVMGSVFTGSMSTLMYSLTAGVVSTLVSAILVQTVYPRISIVSVSVVSAVVHNLTQNIVFCAVTNTPEMYSYAPWLAMIGVLAGVIVGLAVHFVVKSMPYRVLCDVVARNDANREQDDEATDADITLQGTQPVIQDNALVTVVATEQHNQHNTATQPQSKAKGRYHAGTQPQPTKATNSAKAKAKAKTKAKAKNATPVYDRYGSYKKWK